MMGETNVMAAALHPNEEERVKALRGLDILDSMDDPSFQAIVELASSVCGAPISLVTLLDERRQWFKAKVGIDASETPREFAFCAHAILSEPLFEVPDAREDPRFADNPYVLGEPHVRFYAGQRFCTPDGLPLGTVCVIHSLPSRLSDVQRECLRRLALQVEKLIELKLRLQEVSRLRDEALLHRKAVEQMSEGFVLQNTAGEVVHFNSAAARLLGKSTQELARATSLGLDTAASSRDPGLAGARIVGVPTGTREVRWLAVRADPVSSSHDDSPLVVPDHVVTTLTDVTRLRETQQRLIQDAKTKSLGVLAGGLAHELNNPLAIVLGNAQLLRTKLADAHVDGALHGHPIDVIERTVLKMAKLVRALGDFAGESDACATPKASLATLVDACLALCARKLQAHGVFLGVELKSDALVAIPSGHLTQILLNLIDNAFDAVKDLDEKSITLRVESDARTARLFVIDSGPGIPDAVAQHMMDPFFTTKGVGEGMGLGLSVARGLVERFKGTLEYAPVEGHTAFVVTLPTHPVDSQSKARHETRSTPSVTSASSSPRESLP